MFLAKALDFKSQILQAQCSELLEVTSQTLDFGLKLTRSDALEILQTRDLLLSNHGRVELGVEATVELIRQVSSSPYVNSEDFLVTILDLQEVFYYLKNLLGDQVGDEELITSIVDLFNRLCNGSIDLLQGKGLEIILRSKELPKYEY